MLTHEQIWCALDRLATTFGYSPSGLAKQSGLDATSFNKSKRHGPDGKPRWPSTESISRVLAATGATMSDFISLVDSNEIENVTPTTSKKDIAKQCAKILLDTNSILINTKEPFQYTSGNIGPVYVDCRRPIAFPMERSILMDHAAERARALNVDYIAGGETAGIPYAAFIAERLNLPMLYVRKKPKGHGRMAQIEGHVEGNNKKVLLVEDLMNVGSSQKIFIDVLREAGMKIKNSFVIFSYDIYPETKNNFSDMDMEALSLTTWWDVLDVIKEESYFDGETVQSFEAFLNAPKEWAENFKKAS